LFFITKIKNKKIYYYFLIRKYKNIKVGATSALTESKLGLGPKLQQKINLGVKSIIKPKNNSFCFD